MFLDTFHRFEQFRLFYIEAELIVKLGYLNFSCRFIGYRCIKVCTNGLLVPAISFSGWTYPTPLNLLSYLNICYSLSLMIVKGAEVWFLQCKSYMCVRVLLLSYSNHRLWLAERTLWECGAHAHYFLNISASRCNISLSPTSSDSAIIINFHIIVFLLFEQHKIKHLLMPLS